MKILHTSDWHLGQNLFDRRRTLEQEQFLEWLVKVIKNEEIDVLLVAGDVFDTNFPPQKSLEQYYNFLGACQKTNLSHIVIIPGNHDSSSVLAAPQELLHYFNIHIVTPENFQVLKLDLPIGPPLIMAPIPYLKDRDIFSQNLPGNFEERRIILHQKLSAHFQNLNIKAKEVAEKGSPIFAMAHLYIRGGHHSPSERDLPVGHLEALSANDLGDWDYVALGHLHRCQNIYQNIWYSGSPLPLSFKEAKYQKFALLWNDKKITKIPIPKFRNLITFQGTFQEIVEKLENSHQEMDLPNWYELLIQDPHKLGENALKELESNFEILACKLLQTKKETSIQYQQELKEFTPQDVFEKLLLEKNIEDTALYRQSFQEITQELI